MKNVRDLMSRLALLCRLESAIVDELERLHAQIYALEENRKLKDAEILRLSSEIQSLRLAVRGKVHIDVGA